MFKFKWSRVGNIISVGLEWLEKHWTIFRRPCAIGSGRKWSHFNQSHRGVLRGWTLGSHKKDGDTNMDQCFLMVLTWINMVPDGTWFLPTVFCKFSPARIGKHPMPRLRAFSCSVAACGLEWPGKPGPLCRFLTILSFSEILSHAFNIV